jgi:folate-dependent phosphoribosylglycinamide formyltransferase PurN
MGTQSIVSKPSIAVFVCHDLIGMIIVNRLVPCILSRGLHVNIYNTGTKRNRKPKFPAPSDISFYSAGILDRSILPFLKNRKAQISLGTEDIVYPYDVLSQLNNVSYFDVEDVNESNFIEAIKSDGNLIGAISVRFLQVFEDTLIEFFKERGFFWNLHGGILPDYKGLLIPYRAIEKGEKDYGWTLHEVDTSIDTGSIIALCRRPLVKSKPILETYIDMIPYGVDMILESIDRMLKHETLYPIPQKPSEKSAYYPYPTTVEMEKYRQMGVSFIGDHLKYVDFLLSTFMKKSEPEYVAFRNFLFESIRSWLVDQGLDRDISIVSNNKAA